MSPEASQASASKTQAGPEPSGSRSHFSPGPQVPGESGRQARTHRWKRQKEPSGQDMPGSEQLGSQRIQTAPGLSGGLCVSQTCASGQGDCWQFVPWTLAQTEDPWLKRMHA